MCVHVSHRRCSRTSERTTRSASVADAGTQLIMVDAETYNKYFMAFAEKRVLHISTQLRQAASLEGLADHSYLALSYSTDLLSFVGGMRRVGGLPGPVG